MNPCEHLQQVLYSEIPLSKTMQILVTSWENEILTLSFPLAPNKNHLHSVFGGSLYCATILAGWGWMLLRLQELEAPQDTHIVIQKSEISYPHPVLGDAIVSCHPPQIEAWDRFKSTFDRHKKGRLELTSTVHYGGKEAAIFTGKFAVYL